MRQIDLHGEEAVMPDEINVEEIAEEALQTAFAKIAERLADEGYPVTGDFMPGEVFDLEYAFGCFVRSMATNNPTISGMQPEE